MTQKFIDARVCVLEEKQEKLVHQVKLHCLKNVQILFFSIPYFPLSSPNTENTDLKNPYLDVLHTVLAYPTYKENIRSLGSQVN